MQTPAFSSILVPVDGSASADAALGLALRLAEPGGELLIAHVINRAAVVAECVGPYGGDPSPALEALDADERDIFAAAAVRARTAGLRCSTAALDGLPATRLAALARERKVAAIVMGTHGRRGLARIVLGSTAAGVLHDAAVPTFVVHERSAAAVAAPFRQIVVGLDASPAASGAARAAVDLAAHDGGRVFMAHVAERPEAEEGAERAALTEARAYALAAAVPLDAATLHGDPVDALLVSAETCHAELIAIGAHGRTQTLFGMGSVAEAIARLSPVPVLVVPLPAAAASEPRPLHAGAGDVTAA